MCQATGQGYSRERDKHRHPEVEPTNIKLSKHGLLKERTGVRCAGSHSRGSRRRQQGGNGGQARAGGITVQSPDPILEQCEAAAYLKQALTWGDVLVYKSPWLSIKKGS